MFYRVRQFISAVGAKLSKEDIYFIDKYLDEKEKELFYSIARYEQVHSVKVARQVMDESLQLKLYDIVLIKAALLHDIGKKNGGLNLINKPIMVLMDRFMPKYLNRLKKIKAVNTYYNHPQIAVEILADENEYLLFLVKNHHNYEIISDQGLVMLQKADCSN